MKRTNLWIAVFAAVALVCASTSGMAAVLVTAFNPANGHFYHLITAATWDASEVEAVSLSGHLVTINDAAENAWVEATFKTFGSTFWIGYSDAATEGTWLWISGEPTTYTNWGGIEPNDNCPAVGGEDSAIMITNGYGLVGPFPIPDAHWVDIPSNLVCFVPNAPVPLGVVEVDSPTGIGNTPSIAAFEVLPNYPNPFSRATEFGIRLGGPGEVTIGVYDVSGKQVASKRTSLAAGWSRVAIDALDDAGHALPSGVYFCRLHAHGDAITRKILIVR